MTEQPYLRLTDTGPGSRSEIVAYVRQVIGQRTTPNDDTSAERLAEGIVTSILHRLGAGYSVSAGSDRVQVLEERLAALDERVRELEQESRSAWEYKMEMRDRGDG